MAPTFEARESWAEPSGAGVALEVLWKRPLGSGNSRVAVTDGLAVTLFSDGDSDWLIALDAATGIETWRYRIAETYLGHDGSRDGPHASPTISEGVVYGFGPRGDLFAVDLADGTERWSIDIVATLGAVAPFWGFATTPVVVGNKVILEATGREHSAWAFDRDSGRLLWAAASGRVGYQSPAVLMLNGRRQVVAVTNRTLFGIAPESGEVLWQHALGDQDRDGSSEPAAYDGSSFLLSASSTENRMNGGLFRLSEADGEPVLEEVWRSNDLRGSYAVPVQQGGRIYGVRGGILVCLDAATGETLWRSREPGANNLGRAADHLLLTGRRGHVMLARFSEAAYEEVARVSVFERGGPAAPTVVDDTIFLRTHAEIAAVRIVTHGATEVASAVDSRPNTQPRGVIATLVNSLDKVQDKARVVDAFLESQPRIPIVEPDGVAHFLYRGPASDVAIRGAMTDWGVAEPLARIEGTDLFYGSYELGRDGRWEYLFQVDMDQMITDPLNPSTVPTAWRKLSELVMPDWSAPGFFATSDDPEPHLDTFELASEILGNRRDVWVLLPPGYEESSDRYPLLVIFGGRPALDEGDMARKLLSSMRTTDRRFTVAFVGDSKAPFRSWEDHGGPDDYREYGGPDTADHSRMVVEELLPELARRYRISQERREIAIYGVEGVGLAALHAASRYPDIIGGVAVQSMFFGPTPMQSSIFRRHPVFDEAKASLLAEDARPLSIYIDWASHDLRDHEQGIDLARDNLALYQSLEEAGRQVSGGSYPGGPGRRSWMAQLDEILTALFPLAHPSS